MQWLTVASPQVQIRACQLHKADMRMDMRTSGSSETQIERASLKAILVEAPNRGGNTDFCTSREGRDKKQMRPTTSPPITAKTPVGSRRSHAHLLLTSVEVLTSKIVLFDSNPVKYSEICNIQRLPRLIYSPQGPRTQKMGGGANTILFMVLGRKALLFGSLDP